MRIPGGGAIRSFACSCPQRTLCFSRLCALSVAIAAPLGSVRLCRRRHPRPNSIVLHLWLMRSLYRVAAMTLPVCGVPALASYSLRAALMSNTSPRRHRRYDVQDAAFLLAYVSTLPRAQAAKAETRHVDQVPTAMFFAHNTALGPPYHVLIDTNFINFSIKVRPGRSAMIYCRFALRHSSEWAVPPCC